MCQPPGRIVRFPVQDSFALRASPLICVIGMIDTISRILYQFIKGKSFPASCRMLLDARRDDEANHGSFEDLRRNKIFRLKLFLLGALPQAIKIYACRGIPWAQGLCTLYLANFAVNELAAWIAHFDSISETRDEATPPHQTRITFADTHHHAILCFGCAIPLLVVCEGISKSFKLHAPELSLLHTYIFVAAILVVHVACNRLISKSCERDGSQENVNTEFFAALLLVSCSMQM